MPLHRAKQRKFTDQECLDLLALRDAGARFHDLAERFGRAPAVLQKKYWDLKTPASIISAGAKLANRAKKTRKKCLRCRRAFTAETKLFFLCVPCRALNLHEEFMTI